MDYALETRAKWLGSKIADLPTPSLIVSRAIVERNVADLHRDVEAAGVGFRPHVKTLKVGSRHGRTAYAPEGQN